MTLSKTSKGTEKKGDRLPLRNGKYARIFWSKTNGPYQRLSNFSALPITVPASDVQYPFTMVGGRVFPTAEHLFHAMKYCYSDVDVVKGMTLDKYLTHILNDPDPKHAKRTGSRTFFVNNHMNLRVSEWLSAQEDIQRWICRWKRQQHYSTIQTLLEVPDVLVHYESCRTGRPDKLVWGGQVKDGEIIGNNKLGCLWMECANEK